MSQLRFLTHFFDKDEKSTTAQLCATKQAHNDSVDSFIKRWRALAVKCPEPHSHESLTDMCRMNFNSKPRLKLVGLKLKTLGELLAVATETEAALKDHEKEKGGRRSEEASLLKLKRKNQWRYKSLDRKSPTPLRKRTKTGMKRSRQIYLKERLSKVGDFDESKVYAIFDMLIANGQLTLPPCKRPAEIDQVDDSNYCHCRYHRSWDIH